MGPAGTVVFFPPSENALNVAVLGVMLACKFVRFVDYSVIRLRKFLPVSSLLSACVCMPHDSCYQIFFYQDNYMNFSFSLFTLVNYIDHFQY